MRVVALALLLLLLSACAGQSPVDGTRFHHLDGSPRPFVVLPHADQRVDTAFATTADQIGAALAALGWQRQERADGQAAIVRFRHDVDAPVQETVLSPSALPPPGIWGYRRRWDDPFPYWQAQRVVTSLKWLSVTIADGGDASAAPLFEGRVTSRRGGAEIGPILPYLVRGMFDGFPGPSGVTQQKALPVQP